MDPPLIWVKSSDNKTTPSSDVVVSDIEEDKEIDIEKDNNSISLDILVSSKDFEVVVDDLGLRTSNRQKYSYLLSERGYSKLLKVLEDDVVWE